MIAVGDYNFDWDIPAGFERDQGSDLPLRGDVFAWVLPSNLIRTGYTEPESNQFNSVLGFVFVSRDAKGWDCNARVLEEQVSYCA